jgi:hypothetical protein
VRYDIYIYISLGGKGLKIHSVPRCKHCVSVMKINRLMQYGIIIALYVLSIPLCYFRILLSVYRPTQHATYC